MAIADVYDALRSKRTYKPAFSHEKTCEIIREGTGQHFDPNLITVFETVETEFFENHERMSQ
jgi:putative two-component system response regulator